MESFSCTSVMTEIEQTNGKKKTVKVSNLCTYVIAYNVFLGTLQKHRKNPPKMVILKALVFPIPRMALPSFVTPLTRKAEMSTAELLHPCRTAADVLSNGKEPSAEKQLRIPQ